MGFHFVGFSFLPFSISCKFLFKKDHSFHRARFNKQVNIGVKFSNHQLQDLTTFLISCTT